MFFASWLTDSTFSDDSALNERYPRPRRKPIYSRPSLERLEERTLLDASSGLIGGASNNLTLNSNFSFASSGNVLPIPASGQHAPDLSGLVSSGTATQASSDAFLAQDQPNSQFRVFGVNSQGDDVRLAQQNTVNFLRDAYGFGSGAQPNAPWMPNAYNLGLANHQFNYSTQSDFGFSSVPSGARQWSSPVAQSLQEDQNPSLDDDQAPPANQDEKETEVTEQLALHRLLQEQEQAQQRHRLDQDFGDDHDDLNALLEQQASEKPSTLEAAMTEDGVLPDSLWLSALAPAPMAALVAGLPGMSSASEGGDGGAEGGEGGAE